MVWKQDQHKGTKNDRPGGWNSVLTRPVQGIKGE